MYKIVFPTAIFLVITLSNPFMHNEKICPSQADAKSLDMNVMVAASEDNPVKMMDEGRYEEAFPLLKQKADSDPKNKKLNYLTGVAALKIAEKNLAALQNDNSLKKEYVPDLNKDLESVKIVLSYVAEASSRFSLVPENFDSHKFPKAGELLEDSKKVGSDANKLMQTFNDHKAKLSEKVASLLEKTGKLKAAGNLEEAKKVILEAQAIDPENAEVIRQLKVVELILASRALLAEKHFEESRNKAVEAKALDPGYEYIPQLIKEIDIAESNVIYQQGKDLLTTGRFQEAFPILKRSCALDPQSAEKANCLKECQTKYVEALMMEAEPFINQYRLREAEARYMQALEVYPESVLAKEKYTRFKSAASMYHSQCAQSFASSELVGNALANLLEAQHYEPASVSSTVLNQQKTVLQTKSRVGIAIMDFEDPFGQAGAQIKSRILSNVMTLPVVTAGKLDVLQRNVLEQIFKEQRLSMSGLTDQAAVISTGKVRGVGVFIFGRVTEWNSNTVVQQIRSDSKKYVASYQWQNNPKYQNCLLAAPMLQYALGVRGQTPEQACALVPKQVQVPIEADCQYEVNRHTAFATVGVEIQIIDAETSEVIFTDNFNAEAKSSDEEVKPFDMSCASKAGIQPKTPRLRPVQMLQNDAIANLIDKVTRKIGDTLDPYNIWTKKSTWFINNARWNDAVEVLAKIIVAFPGTSYSQEAEAKLAKIFGEHPEAFIRPELTMNQAILHPEAAAPPPVETAPKKAPPRKRR